MNACLELIDPQQGLPLQTWRLVPGDKLQIGRADGADIQISNPFVSRAHAYVHEQDGAWEVVGLSDKGIIVDGDRRTALTLADGVEFRLAPKGPILRLRLEAAESSLSGSAGSATISFDEQTMPILQLDRAQRDRELQEIMADDYFKNVQQIATALRRKRPSATPLQRPADPPPEPL